MADKPILARNRSLQMVVTRSHIVRNQFTKAPKARISSEPAVKENEGLGEVGPVNRASVAGGGRRPVLKDVSQLIINALGNSMELERRQRKLYDQTSVKVIGNGEPVVKKIEELLVHPKWFEMKAKQEEGGHLEKSVVDDMVIPSNELQLPESFESKPNSVARMRASSDPEQIVETLGSVEALGLCSGTVTGENLHSSEKADEATLEDSKKTAVVRGAEIREMDASVTSTLKQERAENRYTTFFGRRVDPKEAWT